MANHYYDESARIAQLAKLPRTQKVLFALLAALRIIPAYDRFVVKTARGNADAVRRLADRLWRYLGGEVMTDEDARAGADEALSLVPSEEHGWDEETQPYAEDAAAALAYAYRARLSDDAEDAAWAARRVYETADRFAVAADDLATSGAANEQRILSHPVVQAELARQCRDLMEIADLASNDEIAKNLARLRARGEAEAVTFFGVPEAEV